MKAFNLFIITLLLFSSSLSGQTWHYEYPHNNIFSSGGSSRTSDGHYVFPINNEIVELSEYGEPTFFYSIDGDFLLTITDVEKQSDGYLISYNENSPASGPLKIGKLGLDGNWLWNTNLAHPFHNISKYKTPTFTLTPNSNIFIGAVDSVYLINSATGQLIWSSFLANNTSFIKTTATNTELAALTRNGILYTMDNSGNLTNTIDLSSNITPQTFISTANEYIVIGENGGIATAIFINKITNTQSTVSYGTGTLYDIKKTRDSGFILAGGDGGEGYLIKINATGGQEWQKIYSGGNVENIETSPYEGYIAITKDNHIFKTDIAGNTKSEVESLNKHFRSISVSNIKTMFNGSGAMFWDYEDTQFNVPKDAPTSTIFASGLWLGGYDNGGNLKIAAEADNSTSTDKDYWAGYTGDGRYFHTDWIDKVWKIRQSELRDFQNDIADGHLTRPIPHDILTWPAIGNPHFKGTIDSVLSIDEPLADFIDVNSDGIYNAYDGDYPVMKGDEMLCWIFTDSKDIHTITKGDPIKADIIARAYGYDCPSNPAIYNTLFVEFDITNVNSTDIDSFFAGMWTDFGLGCPMDDFIGCDTISNSYFAYNDGIDGQGGCGNFPSYGANPPIQSISFLNQSLDHFIYYSTGGFGMSFVPNNATEFYNVLTSKWVDGSPLYATGTGYQEIGATTNYAFPGNPSILTDWSMCTTNIVGSDWRTVGSTGPHSIPSGESMTLSLAYTFHENIPSPCPDISTDVKNNNAAVKTAFDNNNLDWIPNLGTDRTIDPNSTIILEPNVAGTYEWSDNSTNPTLSVTTPGIYSVTITDANGCEKTDEVDITAYTNTGKINSNINMAVFPNPVKKHLNIDFEIKKEQTNFTFNLVNMLGQVLQSKIVANSKGHIILDVQEVPTGIYFLTAEMEGDTIITEKIIIQH